MTADRNRLFVVATGSANLASVVAAFGRIGWTAEITGDPEMVASARRLVLPGVGAFAAVVEHLERSGLADPLRERIAAGRATLTICLGLQVLAMASEESPGIAGLGALPVTVTRFTGPVRVPQLGWNRVAAGPDCQLMRTGDAYFANSFRITECPPGWLGSFSEHGTRFVAALERGPLLACQFHPEISGAWGADLLQRWVRSC